MRYNIPYIILLSRQNLWTTILFTPIFLKSQFHTFFFHFRCLAWSDPAPVNANAFTRAAQFEGLSAKASYRLQKVGGMVLGMVK
jgi:hypothetical protein